MICPGCGAETPDGARFCPNCGTDLHVRGDERRVVTVLFADLVGFTALSEDRDPEQVKRLVDRCFERLVADIETFGGRVDKIVGDAVLALFGAPVAHEDDAERAVRAALQFHRTLDEARADLGVDVRLRVGVNTGEVLVGSLRAGGDYTAMGDVVNTAQRLQSAAEPGQVLVGHATYLATRRVVTYRSVGTIVAKGRHAPVSAWVAEGARLPPGYRPDRHRAPLVGRNDEVALLSHALDLAVAQRRAALFLLVGDAGVGKSRVVEQVAEVARGCHDGLVLQGRCVPYGEANVWWPLAEAVRSGCDIEPGDDQETAATKLRAVVEDVMGRPEAPGDGEAAAPSGATGTGEEVDRIVEGLMHLLGFDVLRGIDAARAREEATGALLTLAAAVARQRPLVIVLSDMHWADGAVLGVVELLLERNARQPIVVLATARPALAERWSPPEGGHHSVMVHIDPLDRDAATEVLHLLAGDRIVALDEAVVGELLDRSGGNPLFLEELVSWLEEARSTELPDTLRGLVAARLDGLTPHERLLLEDAAVLGSRGDVEWLAIMHREAHGGDGAVRSGLGGLQAKDLIALDGEAWEFRSEVVREVTYSTMTKERRAAVHAGIAKWLEREERPHHDAIVDRIAHHYARAAALTAELGGSPGVPRDVGALAVRWLRAAGDRATQADTPRRAARLYSEALATLDCGVVDAADGDAHDRIALLLARSAAYAELREVGPARADADEARDLADAGGDERASVRATVAVAEAALRGGAPDEAEALLGEALARAEAAGDDEGKATALRVRGFAALLCNDPETAIASLEPARELYAALGDRSGLAWALQNISWAHFITGRLDDAESLLHESAALFADLGDRGGLGWALGLLAFTRFHSGYPDEAETMAEQVFGGAEAAGDRWAVGMGKVLTASIRLWTGRAESAVERAREALATFDAIEDDYGRVQARLPLGRALVTAGRVAEGFEVLEQARASLLPSHSPRFTEFSATGLLSAAVQVGDRDRALAAVAILPEQAPSSDDLATAGASEHLVSRALLALQRGRPDEALGLLRELERAIGERGIVGYPGAVTALALAAAGRVDEALAAARVVEDDDRSTYLDRTWAGLAAGAVAARCGLRDVVDARFPELCAQVDATDDRIAQALARLGWAMALEVLDDRAAAPLLGEASDRFASLGVEPDGWAAVIRQAVGMTPAEPAPA
ncbi:MAG TPA: adenylate/guanylate cyclase domain-containing protein [Acidimicrobiales bacterium]|nr:adenylate/guanylate cyclase domain-containing protein [Acidimicrobiales bacterium]